MAFGRDRFRALAAAVAAAAVILGSGPAWSDEPSGQSKIKQPFSQLAQICNSAYFPVCGWRNGRWRTYRNRCWALRGGARNIRSGACTGGGGGASATCRNYARNAVNHNNLNRQRRCGYSGSRWQSNYRNHYSWCLRAPQFRRTQEHNARARDLNRCGARGNKAAICRNYANAAWNAQRSNVNRRCGYRGTRWQFSRANHYNWCMRAPAFRRNQETNARNAALNRCRGAGGGGGICNDNRPVCGTWRGRRVNFVNICVARQRRATALRWGRCRGGGGGGGAAGSCWLGNAQISVSSAGCGTKTRRLDFPFRRLSHGASTRRAYNSGPIGRGARPFGVCNFHTDLVYRCWRGRLRIQNVVKCQQAREKNANCRVSN